ncbi:MAG: RsmE family RNA methyltransferase [Leadbetterella sp.]
MSLKIDSLFYTENFDKTLVLDETEAKHCVLVLRKTVGDVIYVANGRGQIFECEVVESSKKSFRLILKHTYHQDKGKQPSISIAIAPTKNADRIEYFIEKAVEIGVDAIYIIKTQHTVAKHFNIERARKIVVSAAKQSLKWYFPTIESLQSLHDFVINKGKDFSEKYIAHLDQNAREIQLVNPKSSTIILIGPEGDFSKDEVMLANQNGFQTLKLGSERLRTETAGVVSASFLCLNRV